MTEESYVPFKAQNTPKGKVSLNQVTQMAKENKRILNNNNPQNSWTASNVLLELFSSTIFWGRCVGKCGSKE